MNIEVKSIPGRPVIDVFGGAEIKPEMRTTISVEELTLEKLEKAFRMDQTVSSRCHAAVNDLKKDLTRHQREEFSFAYKALREITSLTHLPPRHSSDSSAERLLFLVPEQALENYNAESIMDDVEQFLLNLGIQIRHRKRNDIIFKHQRFLFCAHVGFESEDGFFGLSNKLLTSKQLSSVEYSSFLPFREKFLSDLPPLLMQLQNVVQIWRNSLQRQHVAFYASLGEEYDYTSISYLYPDSYALDLLCIYFFYAEYGTGHGSLLDIFRSFMNFIVSIKTLSDGGCPKISFHSSQFQRLYSKLHISSTRIPEPPEVNSTREQIILWDPLIPNCNVLQGYRGLAHLQMCAMLTLDIYNTSLQQVQDLKVGLAVFIEAIFAVSDLANFSISESWGNFVGMKANFTKLVEPLKRKHWHLFRV